jgi:hypothetical protein
MGYLSSYFGGSKPTKYLIAGRISALIECVRNDVGMNGLMSGLIVLNNDFTVSFQNMDKNPDLRSTVMALVSPKTQLKICLTDDEFNGLTILSRNTEVDRLTYAVITSFERQSQSFDNLEPIFKRTGGYVFLGMSALFRGEKDAHEVVELLGQRSKSHYLMQTYESMGEAKERARKEEDAFAGGVVCAYEILL